MSHEFQIIETNSVKLRVAVQGEGPLVVMVHGFPESWYSWRHQMKALAETGYMAAAMDVRGYGGSDKPHEIAAYSMANMTADVAGVIDALSPGKPAAIVGHDWGAPIVWHTAVLHPGKVRAVAGLSVPYFGQLPMPATQIYKATYTDQGKFFYQVYFQDEGVAEAEFEADVRGGLRKLYYAVSGEADGLWGGDKVHGDALLTGLPDPDPFPAWLTPTDIDYFVAEFERSGFRGPLNRYRNFERDWAHMNTIADRVVRQPALFITGDRDLVIRVYGQAMIERMRETVADLRGVHMLPGVGHWTQQEAPEATNSALLAWLRAL